MVTDLQFYNAVKSYKYRNSLIRDLPEIKSDITQYLQDKELSEVKIPGYSIALSNGSINITEAPIRPLNQLELKLNEGGDN